MKLEDLGWNTHFETAYRSTHNHFGTAGRVSFQHKHLCEVLCENGASLIQIPKALYDNTMDQNSIPVVGDWVLISPGKQGKNGTVHSILTRKTILSIHKSEGLKMDNMAQYEDIPLAANVDVLFLVCGLDSDLNLRNIEWYLTIAYNSGAKPVILLTKADICSNTNEIVTEIESIAFGVPIHLLSATKKDGFEAITHYFRTGITGAFMGASGAGKSAILNQLLGYDLQKVHKIDKSGKGDPHLTIVRELIPLPSGGVVIENKALREIRVFAETFENTDRFKTIETLIHSCRFSDCRHVSEPGCAVKQAIDDGELDERSLNNYLKIKREADSQGKKRSKTHSVTEKDKWKTVRMMNEKETENLYKKRST